MRTKAELVEEVEDRNKLRAEVGFPLVSLPEEVKKLEEAEREAEYDRKYQAWYTQNAALISRIKEEVLASESQRRGIPNWKPTLLNGSSDFEAKVRRKFKKQTGVNWPSS